MRIDGNAFALPARIVSNRDVLDLIRQRSEGSFAGDLDRALNRIGALLRRSGLESRHWLGAGESPLELTSSAVEAALAESGHGSDEIDVLIHAAVDRGYVEPATAYFIAKELGMNRVHCFDVVDACNSWSRTLLLLHSLLATGFYRRALVVSPEFPLYEGGPVFPTVFGLEDDDDAKRSFAAFTLGEGVSATVLSFDPDRSWEFRFSSRADLADTCVVPLPGHSRYGHGTEAGGLEGVFRFSADSARMFSHARDEILTLLGQLTVRFEDVAAVFTHAATRQEWLQGLEPLGLADRVYDIYRTCGNIASASIPTAIAWAAAEGLIARGDRVLCLTGSAGMSFAAYTFVY